MDALKDSLVYPGLFYYRTRIHRESRSLSLEILERHPRIKPCKEDDLLKERFRGNKKPIIFVNNRLLDVNDELWRTHGSPFVLSSIRKCNYLPFTAPLAAKHALNSGFKLLRRDGNFVIATPATSRYCYNLESKVFIAEICYPPWMAEQGSKEWLKIRTAEEVYEQCRW